MIHTLYETLNCKNGKHYIGVHSTNDPYDDYLGSGDRITQAVKRHGRKNFEKFIIGVFPTKEDALLAEQAIVTPEFVKKRDNYNVMGGGLTQAYIAEETRKKMAERKRGSVGHWRGKSRPESTRRKISKSLTGVKLAPERRAAMSERLKGNKHSLGHKQSAETKAKRAASLKAWCKANPDKVLARVKKSWETRRKLTFSSE